MQFLANIPKIPIFYMASLLIIMFFTMGSFIYYIRNIFVKESQFDTANTLITRLGKIIFPLFAFLLASVAVMIVSKKNEIQHALQVEAESVVDIVFIGSFLPLDVQEKVHHNLKEYLLFVKNEEWKNLEHGKILYEGRSYITHTLKDLHTYLDSNPHNLHMIQNIIKPLQKLSDARRERCEISIKKIHPYMWTVLLINSIISLFIVIFFLNKNIPGQFLAIFLISIPFGLIFSLLIGFNNPFVGSLSLSPSIIEDSIKSIDTILNQNKVSSLQPLKEKVLLESSF